MFVIEENQIEKEEDDEKWLERKKRDVEDEKEVKRVSNTQASQLVSYATTDRAVACLASQSGTGCGISKPL